MPLHKCLTGSHQIPAWKLNGRSLGFRQWRQDPQSNMIKGAIMFGVWYDPVHFFQCGLETSVLLYFAKLVTDQSVVSQRSTQYIADFPVINLNHTNIGRTVLLVLFWLNAHQVLSVSIQQALALIYEASLQLPAFPTTKSSLRWRNEPRQAALCKKRSRHWKTGWMATFWTNSTSSNESTVVN